MITLWGQGALSRFDPANANFAVPFADLGSGLVDITPSAGIGAGTFARTGAAWTKLASGLWASVGNGLPRSKYWGEDTAIGAYGGFFREMAGTQLVTPTAAIRDMTDASWVKTTMTTAKTSTGIDGTANSCTRLTAAGANSLILQTLVAAASSRTYSCFIKRITGTGNIEITQDGTTFTNVTAQVPADSQFHRVQLNASQLNAVFGIRLVTNADAVDVDFNQFEAGGYASSPMAAAGAARNADSLTYDGANVNPALGTCYAEVQLPAGFLTADGQQHVRSDSGSNGQMLAKVGGAATTTASNFDGVNVLTKTGAPDQALAIVKQASSWGGSTKSVTAANLAPQSGTFDGSMGDGTILTVAAASQAQGTIKNLKIWFSQASDTQLQALTA